MEGEPFLGKTDSLIDEGYNTGDGDDGNFVVYKTSNMPNTTNASQMNDSVLSQSNFMSKMVDYSSIQPIEEIRSQFISHFNPDLIVKKETLPQKVLKLRNKLSKLTDASFADAYKSEIDELEIIFKECENSRKLTQK